MLLNIDQYLPGTPIAAQHMPHCPAAVVGPFCVMVNASDYLERVRVPPKSIDIFTSLFHSYTDHI